MSIGSDLRYALRTLSRARGFTLAVILTHGLGIGANTAIFSVVRGVLLKPLPHRDGDRLLYLRQSINGPGGENVNFSVPEINDFRDEAKSLGGIAEYSPLTLTMLRMTITTRTLRKPRTRVPHRRSMGHRSRTCLRAPAAITRMRAPFPC